MNWLEILERAMKLEQNGRKFYLRAAALIDGDADVVKMFRRLADDELDHYTFLQREYAEILCNDQWCKIPELEDVEAPDEAAPIFPRPETVGEVLPEDASLEDVLLFALDAEDKTVNLYQESAEQAEDPRARAFFSQLARVERGHFDTVLQRYESYFGYPR
ncbi:MAG: ferritin-like domain-containing protein [Anaerolineae bacterium]